MPTRSRTTRRAAARRQRKRDTRAAATARQTKRDARQAELNAVLQSAAPLLAEGRDVDDVMAHLLPKLPSDMPAEVTTEVQGALRDAVAEAHARYAKATTHGALVTRAVQERLQELCVDHAAWMGVCADAGVPGVAPTAREWVPAEAAQ
jgi:hypothetical protein